MMKKVLLPCLALCLYLYSYGQHIGDRLFDERVLHEVKIFSDSSDLLEDLFDLYKKEHLTGSYTYLNVDVLLDGERIDSVGIRVKGGISGFDSKKPLKIDFNEFVRGKNYDGIKKVNLHQGNMEASYLREAVAYNILRTAGVKCSRTSFARVYINDEYQGLYTLVEQIDATFLKERFASNQGALYKALVGLQEKIKIDSSFSPNDFFDLVERIPISDLHSVVTDYLDLNSFLHYFAAMVMMNSVDGPIQINENYYMYYEPKSARYIYIPWDFNLALYPHAKLKLDDNTNHRIFKRIIQNDSIKTQYLDIACRLLDYNFTESRLGDLIDYFKTQVEAAVLEDPFYAGGTSFDEAAEDLKSVIRGRIDEVSNELRSLQIDCIPITLPSGGRELVLNEIVASSDSMSGISDPNGGYPDWIEIYNNSDQPVSLNKYYLSNDVHTPKHWAFPSDATIGPGEYVIVWADRDVDEEGLHSDFKLDKSGGDLLLSYDDGEIIDQMSYDAQETNIALARVPNGVGDFVNQPSTWKQSNDMLTSVQTAPDEKEVLIINPNPVSPGEVLGIVWMEEPNSPYQLSIRSVTGEVISSTGRLSDYGRVHRISGPRYPGFYLIVIESENMYISKRLIVQ